MRTNRDIRKKRRPLPIDLKLVVPLALSVPLLMCCCLSPFEAISGGLGAMLGFIAFLGSCIAAYMLANTYELDVGENVPWILRGGWMIAYYQIKWLIERPQLIAGWIFLEFVGLIVMIAAPSLTAVMKAPVLFGLLTRHVRVSGNKAVDQALEDIDSGQPDRCFRGVEFFTKTPPDDTRAKTAAKLAEMAQDPFFVRRNAAMRSLSVWATPAEVPVLIDGLNHADLATRNDALFGIGALRDERTVEPVARCFSDFMTRQNAAKALRDMGPMAERPVLAILDHKDDFLRADAIKVLKDIGTEQSVASLEPIAAGNNVFTKKNAQDALAAIRARKK